MLASSHRCTWEMGPIWRETRFSRTGITISQFRPRLRRTRIDDTGIEAWEKSGFRRGTDWASVVQKTERTCWLPGKTRLPTRHVPSGYVPHLERAAIRTMRPPLEERQSLALECPSLITLCPSRTPYSESELDLTSRLLYRFVGWFVRPGARAPIGSPFFRCDEQP